MDNSLKTKEKPPEDERANAPPRKGKTKAFLIDKELKTKYLHHTAAVRASEPTPKPNPKPRIASAKGRVKPLARLLCCATALRVTLLPSTTAQMAGRAGREPFGPQPIVVSWGF